MSEIVDMLRLSADDMEMNPGIVQRFSPESLRRLADRIDAEMAELPRGKDGRPIRIGETVYDDYGKEWHVCGVTIGESPTSWEDHDVHVTNDRNEFESFGSVQLTHERPDSWERIADDIRAEVESLEHGSFASDDALDALRDYEARIRRLADAEAELGEKEEH